MLSQDVILGFCAIIGGIVFMFNRFGWIKLGKNGNNNKVITEIRTLSDVQIVQGQILKTHEKRLDDGREDFKGIKKDIGQIKIDVGVLISQSSRRRVGDSG